MGFRYVNNQKLLNSRLDYSSYQSQLSNQIPEKHLVLIRPLRKTGVIPKAEYLIGDFVFDIDSESLLEALIIK